MPGGLRVDVHLTSEETAGAFSMMVDHPQAGWSLPPQRHASESETIHVVAGRFETVVDGEPIVAGPGETVHVPQGVVHSGRILGPLPGRRVLIFAPGGMDRFFLEAGTDAPDVSPEPAELLDIAGRHGWRFD